MNQIIESFLDIHKKEYSLDNVGTEIAFEHFMNRCIINKYSNDRFDPSDIMTDNGEKGLDGVAICINGRIITTHDELTAIITESGTIDVHFIFIQSKISEHFDGDQIGSFVYGVRAFFAKKDIRPKTNEKMENLISLKDEIYTHSIDMGSSPSLDMYFVNCGKWSESNGLSSRIDIEIQPLKASQNFSKVSFFPYDSDKIIATYKELKKKVSRSFAMEKKVVFPAIDGVKQAFLGLVKCKDFVSILGSVKNISQISLQTLV